MTNVVDQRASQVRHYYRARIIRATVAAITSAIGGAIVLTAVHTPTHTRPLIALAALWLIGAGFLAAALAEIDPDDRDTYTAPAGMFGCAALVSLLSLVPTWPVGLAMAGACASAAALVLLLPSTRLPDLDNQAELNTGSDQ